MEKIIWVGLVGADMVYVGATFMAESMMMLLSRRVDRFERRIHSIPDERYFTEFATPVLAFVGGLAGGISTSLIGEGPGATALGFTMSAIIVFAVARNQYSGAIGHRPRPAVRARWRREAAGASRALDNSSALTALERRDVQQRAHVLGGIGSRITAAVRQRTWRDAFQAESRKRQAATVMSVALPIAASLWASFRYGLSGSSLLGHAVLLAVSAAAVATPTLRWVQTRRSLLALGQELSEYSRDLLQRLSQTASPRPRVLRVRPTTTTRHFVRRHARST
ncbi:hypothetical protein [Streptomyces sp. NPDC051218]|uniref:hypothetical protein n=1 Tax=Streptomyces sp. NPDC051218 TaxID=3365645 RepID=UPI0037A38EA0